MNQDEFIKKVVENLAPVYIFEDYGLEKVKADGYRYAVEFVNEPGQLVTEETLKRHLRNRLMAIKYRKFKECQKKKRKLL